jgi:hypothetical protein
MKTRRRQRGGMNGNNSRKQTWGQWFSSFLPRSGSSAAAPGAGRAANNRRANNNYGGPYVEYNYGNNAGQNNDDPAMREAMAASRRLMQEQQNMNNAMQRSMGANARRRNNNIAAAMAASIQVAEGNAFTNISTQFPGASPERRLLLIELARLDAAMNRLRSEGREIPKSLQDHYDIILEAIESGTNIGFEPSPNGVNDGVVIALKGMHQNMVNQEKRNENAKQKRINNAMAAFKKQQENAAAAASAKAAANKAKMNANLKTARQAFLNKFKKPNSS